MNRKLFLTLFSRLLFTLLGASVLFFAYVVLQTLLAPVSVPPAPPAKKSVSFDPQLDVSKNQAFTRLRPIGPQGIEIGKRGRSNPFSPVPTSTRESARHPPGVQRMLDESLPTSPTTSVPALASTSTPGELLPRVTGTLP